MEESKDERRKIWSTNTAFTLSKKERLREYLRWKVRSKSAPEYLLNYFIVSSAINDAGTHRVENSI